jgi:tetratricopeptide (TPR) repeat protein
MASSAVILSPDLGLAYPDTVEVGTDNISALWHAHLNQTSQITQANVDPSAWTEASLRWLINHGSRRDMNANPAPRIGTSDVERFKETVRMFAQLDDRFGGGHCQSALIQYLATDGERLLRGRFPDTVGRSLYSALSEATLLAAWMSYDSSPNSGLAQRYFIQALALANAGENRLLGASILDAMSHQATFVNRYHDAANLAVAARTGTMGVATPTQTAHFYSMEARAHARIGDARACDLAISNANRTFDQRNPNDDPEWIRYFDEAELSAEIGHCFRDLGRPIDAAQHATQCLAMISTTTSPRSRFFAYMVLADSHLSANEIQQAYDNVIKALDLGEQIRSARCVSYIREFRDLLATVGPHSGSSEFEERVRQYRLWRLTATTHS